MVFTRVRLAVFVDECFRHDCPQHGTRPKARSEWWKEKLRRNVARDRDTDLRLQEVGWTVLRFWEHEDVRDAAERIRVVYKRLGVTPPRT